MQPVAVNIRSLTRPAERSRSRMGGLVVMNLVTILNAYYEIDR